MALSVLRTIVNSAMRARKVKVFSDLRARIRLSDYADRVPSMMLQEEREFLGFLAAEFYTGAGIIFEGGVFLGSSSVAFAEGLRRRRRRPQSVLSGVKPIHAYDMAICDFAMAHKINLDCGSNLVEGDSFESYLRSYTSSFLDLIEIKIGDIVNTSINESFPIEILFYDCGKTPEVNDYIVKNKFTMLMPGKSLLIQQDFFHEWAPWLLVSMGALRHHFSYLGRIGPTVVFRCDKPVTEGDAHKATWEMSNIAESFSHADWCRGLSDDLGAQYMIDLAKCVLACVKQGAQAGIDLLDTLTMPELQKTRFGAPLTDKAYVRQGMEWHLAHQARSAQQQLANVGG